jgi:hypothetical protein
MHVLTTRWIWKPQTQILQIIWYPHFLGRVWKHWVPPPGMASGVCLLPCRSKCPESRPPKSCDFHSLLQPAKWTAKQGLKTLRPTSGSCILACVCCQMVLRTPSPNPLKHENSLASFSPQGDKVLDGVYTHWAQHTECLGPSVCPVQKSGVFCKFWGHPEACWSWRHKLGGLRSKW